MRKVKGGRRRSPACELEETTFYNRETKTTEIKENKVNLKYQKKG